MQGFNANSEVDLGGTGNLPVPPGYQPGGREAASIRPGLHKIVGRLCPFRAGSRRAAQAGCLCDPAPPPFLTASKQDLVSLPCPTIYVAFVHPLRRPPRPGPDAFRQSFFTFFLYMVEAGAY